jgi:integrase
MNPTFLAFTGAKKWIPLIALYSGMRLSEICHLASKDVREVNGIWVFDVNDAIVNGPPHDPAEAYCAKTDTAARLVPVHPFLIEHEFLAYARTIKSSRKKLLFPELKSTSKIYPKEYHRQFARWFRSLCSQFGVTDSGLSFHSFRFMAGAELKAAGVPDGIVNSIFGFPNSCGSLQEIFEGVKALDYRHSIWLTSYTPPVRKKQWI